MKKSTLLRIVNVYPPFLGAGIRVMNIAPDFTAIAVEMKLRWWNKNYVGTQFGGSLYSMTDPFLMLMLMENLGPRYIVWDKSATIRFKSPGKGRVRVNFHISPREIAAIRDEADTRGKTEPHFHVQVVSDDGTVVAEVEKILSVRRKDAVPPPKKH